MLDVGKPSAGDSWRFRRIDPKPVSLNVRPETPREEAGQEASENLPFEYNRSAAALSGVEAGRAYLLVTWCPPIFPRPWGLMLVLLSTMTIILTLLVAP